MTPILLFPAALGALAALAIPLVIHLVRQTPLDRIDFAALRWLTPRPRPRSRLRFDEWLLLAIRLLLFTLVALWLAHPAVYGADDRTPRVVVVPGAVAPRATDHGVWLAPGFPSLDHPSPAGPVAIASLLRDYDAGLPHGVTLTVVVPAELNGLDAERPRLSHAVTWRVTGGATSAAAKVPVAPVGLAVRYAPDRVAALPYLRAVAAAWAGPGHAVAFDAATSPAPLPIGGPLVWLVPGAVSPSVLNFARRGGTVLLEDHAIADVPETVVWRDAIGAPLVSGGRFGRGHVLRLHRRFDPIATPELLDPDFPSRLAALLTDRTAPSRAAARDFAPAMGGPFFAPPPHEIRSWLALAIAGVFLIERLVATGRRRAAP